ncbi:TonB-dependent receptor plug domain-containing protein [Pelobacter propionicus]|uniref:TonB-dependent receptor n=1 Tax=Pelobacter propionicus (strain DSM 2379 / NBRC 103807 / OttBd1) TaxID=338966 RepID=A1AP86_PELPD|nr:TonB-dependent receptor [Pelobacter propionicus]ABK99156.1 TonB-dependent receptor [Pelobacter propionicus DSM 2379]
MNTKITVGAVCLAACGLLAPQHSVLAAQQGDEDTEAYNLGEIVVSGKTEGVQAAETVHTVTAEDIRSMNATTLDQAISLLPGVNVRIGPEGVPRIDVRGFRTRHVILLLNGVPLNSALDGQFDPTTIPTENIAMIKMTSGASSVLYGQGGLGGVINIITKKGSKDISGMVSAETGDHYPYLVRSSLAAKKDAFDFFISGSSTDVDGFPLSDSFDKTSVQDSDYRKNSDRERHNVLGTIGYNPNDDLSLGFTFTYNQGEYGKPPGTIDNNKDPFASTPKYERIESYEGLSLQLAGDYRFTDKLNLRGWAYRNQLHMQDYLYADADYDSFTKKSSFKERVRTTIHGISLQPRYDFGAAGTLTFSTINEWDQWKNDGLTSSANNKPLDTSRDESKQYSVHTLAAEYELSPLEGLGLVAGYGHHWQAREHSSDNDYSVNAGIHYDILKDTRLKFSFNRNIRFPTLGDLYGLSEGNPDLDTERSLTFEGGVEQKLPFNSRISLIGFHTEVKDLIQKDKTTDTNMNVSKVVYDGFEIAAATQFTKNILLRASYTYLDSKVKDDSEKEQLQYTPHDKFTFEGKYDFDCGFTPYVSVQYVANQYFYTKDTAATFDKGKLNDYVLLNVKLSQRFFDNRFTTYFGVNNIFDENYETSYGYPQAGRFIYGGIELRI